MRNLDFIARGSGDNSQFQANVIQLPLDLLDIRPAVQYGFGAVAGRLDASIDADLTNLNNPIVTGEVAIADPSLSPIDAEQLTASFAYANNTVDIQQGELLFDDSRYLLTASAALPSSSQDDIEYEGLLTVAEGRIEDLVPIIEAIDFSNFGIGDPATPLGSAVDLATVPVGVPNATLLERLDSFVAFLEENPPEETESGDLVLPGLDELTGEFTGAIEVAGRTSAPSELTADFNLQGGDWEWGQYTEDNEFLVRGEVQQGALALDTAYVNAGDTQVTLAADGDLDQLDGRLVVENLPIELVELIYPLPATVTGELDTITTFGGSLSNPVVVSEVAVTDAEVNSYAINRIGADLDYRNAVLTIDGEIAVLPVEGQLDSEIAEETITPISSLVSSNNPVVIEGSIPYAFGFMDVVPPTQQINLIAVVPSENFALVNAVTDDQVRWESGQGEIVVQVGGTVAQPLFAGEATLRDGVLTSELLGDPVTNISGDILFNLEQIDIQQFQAQINDGQLIAEGRLPLEQLQQTNTNGILISLESLPIDYNSLLQADFDGQVLVTGTVLAPTISGGLALANGQIRANQLLQGSDDSNLPTEEELEEISPYRAEYFDIDPLEVAGTEEPAGALDNVAIQDFTLAFGDRLTILGQPFYNITAAGDLTVNGTLANLQPDGVVQLRTGWINLFSTRFRLDRNATNTATFTPDGGLDPFLDVDMLARVQETDITNTPVVAGGFLSADINETPVETTGNVEYISVRAEAVGPASEVGDNLVLTSDPSRDQGALVALIGSGLFTDLTGASYLQAAEFIGAGSLSTFGDRVADAVGLESFRIFPTTDTGEDSTTAIGIGLEATAGIGDRFDIDFLQVLNSSNRPQIGVGYQFTDNLNIRGASNLDIDDTDFELEYRIRF